jgi:hypothetical protein
MLAVSAMLLVTIHHDADQQQQYSQTVWSIFKVPELSISGARTW